MAAFRLRVAHIDSPELAGQRPWQTTQGCRLRPNQIRSGRKLELTDEIIDNKCLLRLQDINFNRDCRNLCSDIGSIGGTSTRLYIWERH